MSELLFVLSKCTLKPCMQDNNPWYFKFNFWEIIYTEEWVCITCKWTMDHGFKFCVLFTGWWHYLKRWDWGEGAKLQEVEQ